jgi:glycosyltransferase involved in cell wall biosynthesis
VSPRVSILIPAYNEAYFREALASARAQQHDSFEIVVCDDSPGTAIEAWVAEGRDPRVRYIRNRERLGFEGNFTECLRQARAPLAKFLNDDDRLRPECIAHLAAALDADPRITLATSRRDVIDERGAPRAGLPATSPVSYVSCVTTGIELGDLTFINGLNLIGEPSTAMFRARDLMMEAGGIFTWKGKPYHCLADLSLWLRLLAKGNAYYCASALSEYRVHAGQEQRSPRMGIKCVTERLDLAEAGREEGFLRADAAYRNALVRVELLAAAWREHLPADAPQRATLDALSATIAQKMVSGTT